MVTSLASADTPLAVDQARQAAIATFTADGFKAAAVTAVAMVAGAMPLPTGLTLVAGWVAVPAAFAGDGQAPVMT